MTLVPEWKICPECHKKYSWNPDVGKFRCPYCGGLGKKSGTLRNVLFSNRKKDK